MALSDASQRPQTDIRPRELHKPPEHIAVRVPEELPASCTSRLRLLGNPQRSAENPLLHAVAREDGS